jgi:hypothetical protein
MGRVKMGKMVRGVIAAGELPPHRTGSPFLVESRFDGQAPKTATGEWQPLRRETTLWLGGVPWDGYVDLRYQRDGVVEVRDFKFSSDIHTYAKPADKLVSTIQMPVYALDSMRIWPEATEFRLVHHYISRRGVDSFLRVQTVHADVIRARTEHIAQLVVDIQKTARATSQDDVPFNRRACHAYTGCPHQSICTAFRRNQVMLELKPEEMALFDIVTPPEEKPAASPPLAELTPSEQRDALADPVEIPLPVASTPARQPPAPTTASPPPAARTCSECPHPAHPGASCTGKRGRGACRCGQAQTTPAPKADPQAPTVPEQHRGHGPAVAAGHFATCVQSDGGEWLCMDGCTATDVGDPGPRPRTGIPLDAAELGGSAAYDPKLDPHRVSLAHAPPVGRPAALRLEIDLGPRAAAILERIAPALVELLKW